MSATVEQSPVEQWSPIRDELTALSSGLGLARTEIAEAIGAIRTALIGWSAGFSELTGNRTLGAYRESNADERHD